MADPIRIVFGDEADSEELRSKLARPISIRLCDGGDWNQQLLLLTLVDLLRRVLPRVEVDLDDENVPAHSKLPPGPATLRARINEVSAFGREVGVDAGEQDALKVLVGANADQQASAPALHVNGRGWASFVGTEPGAISVDEGLNPIGPLTAACRAAAAIVGRLLGETDTLAARAYWDALDPRAPMATAPEREPATLGRRVEALLMGCGSIGGAVAYAFARTPGIGGELILLDDQALEDRNLAKAILARPDDVAAGRNKVDVAADELGFHRDLILTPRVKTLANHVAERPRAEPLPLVLCAVDSIESRRELQDSLPLEVVNGACDGADAFVSGHITDAGPCVYCLHIEQVLDSAATRIRLIEGTTGMPARAAAELIEKRVPLSATHLIKIERYRGLKNGALARYLGETLDQLYESELRYGEQHLDLAQGTRVAIPAPWVTALVGFLVAAEALKYGHPNLQAHRLGPAGESGLRYHEHVGEPSGIVTNLPPRFPGQECLCNDERRLRLMHERYRTPVQS